MEITEVKIFPVKDAKLKAFVSVVLDGCFMVNDIRIVAGKQGLFISMPNRRRRNGELKDIAHPLNQETRRRFEERILAALARLDGGAAPEAASVGEAAGAAPAETLEPQRERSLEEVEELHLKDSFWSLT